MTKTPLGCATRALSLEASLEVAVTILYLLVGLVTDASSSSLQRCHTPVYLTRRPVLPTTTITGLLSAQQMEEPAERRLPLERRQNLFKTCSMDVT